MATKKRTGRVSRKSKGRNGETDEDVRKKWDAATRKALLGDFALEDAHLYRAFRSTFTIYLGNETTDIFGEGAESAEPGVEHNMANRFELNLHILSNIDPNRPILIIQASDGGYWEAGMQMFGAILACPNPVTIIAVRNARSMTSIIPLAADRFLIRPPAQYMFHHGTWTFDGLMQEGATDFFEVLKAREMMLLIYTTRLKEQGRLKNTDEKQIRELLERFIEKRIDVWIEPLEARNWGFVDGVVSGIVTRAHLAGKRNEKRRAEMGKILRTTFKPDELIKQWAENYNSKSIFTPTTPIKSSP